MIVETAREFRKDLSADIKVVIEKLRRDFWAVT